MVRTVQLNVASAALGTTNQSALLVAAQEIAGINRRLVTTDSFDLPVASQTMPAYVSDFGPDGAPGRRGVTSPPQTLNMSGTDDFQAVSHDKHLRVNYSAVKMPERHSDAKPNPEEIAQQRKEMEKMNCGFEKVEHLSGNVGYLKFDFFGDPDVCGPTAVAAMNFLANVDAIIFDLRENGGGDPKMVAFLSTYLFDEPTHLNDLWERKGDVTHQYWTLPYVPGKLLAGKPVYVLTSHDTFSGGEEFCYNLKNLKRATLIGETTGGGAHPVSGHRIDDHFMIGVPFARAINPISKTNWEGTGVEPDIKVPAADALTTAQKLVQEKLSSK